MKDDISRIHPEFANAAASLESAISQAVIQSKGMDASVVVNMKKDGTWNYRMCGGKVTRLELLAILNCITEKLARDINNGDR